MVSSCDSFSGVERMNNLNTSFLCVDLSVCRAPVPRTVAPFVMDLWDAARQSLELKHQPLSNICGESKNAAWGRRFVVGRSLLTTTQFLSSTHAPRQLARSSELPWTLTKQHLPIYFRARFCQQNPETDCSKKWCRYSLCHVGMFWCTLKWNIASCNPLLLPSPPK